MNDLTKEIQKYVLRFGLVIVLAVPILLLTQGAQAVKIICYKIAMVSIGLGLAELWWAVAFKPQFGKTEGMNSGELIPVILFRGLLYAAIILACTLGL